MQNPACSSSICEPRASVPNASASLKPVKTYCCFSQMCWGKQTEGTHSFSGSVKHIALSTVVFMLKPANMPSHWEHLGWSRGDFFLYLEKNCPFCTFPSSQFIVRLEGWGCTYIWKVIGKKWIETEPPIALLFITLDSLLSSTVCLLQLLIPNSSLRYIPENMQVI